VRPVVCHYNKGRGRFSEGIQRGVKMIRGEIRMVFEALREQNWQRPNRVFDPGMFQQGQETNGGVSLTSGLKERNGNHRKNSENSAIRIKGQHKRGKMTKEMKKRVSALHSYLLINSSQCPGQTDIVLVRAPFALARRRLKELGLFPGHEKSRGSQDMGGLIRGFPGDLRQLSKEDVSKLGLEPCGGTGKVYLLAKVLDFDAARS